MLKKQKHPILEKLENTEEFKREYDKERKLFERFHEEYRYLKAGPDIGFSMYSSTNKGFSEKDWALISFHGFALSAQMMYRDILKYHELLDVFLPEIGEIGDFDGYLSELRRFMADRIKGRVILKGTSFGAIIALNLFIRNPDKVGGIILSHPLLYSRKMAKLAALLVFFSGILTEKAVKKLISRFMQGILRIPEDFIESGKVTPRLYARKRIFIDNWNTNLEWLSKKMIINQLRILIKWMKNIDFSRIRKKVLDDKRPILIISAKNDFAIKELGFFPKSGSNIKAVLFEDTGHMGGILKEKEVGDAIEEFIRDLLGN